MAPLTRSILVKSDGSYTVETPSVIVPSPLYRHKDDAELWGNKWSEERQCAITQGGCPAVHPLLPNSDHKVWLNEHWQYFIRAINWGMSLKHVAALFGYKKAFTNRKEDDLRANWISRTNLSQLPPDQDRVRSCSRAPLIVQEVRGDWAAIRMMDGRLRPPLKEGYTYPDHVSKIDPNAYLYHPKTHPGMFLVATITNSDGKTRPFPNGAVYDWIGDNQPYVFWPYVANREIVYPLANLVKISSFETPYT